MGGTQGGRGGWTRVMMMRVIMIRGEGSQLMQDFSVNVLTK